VRRRGSYKASAQHAFLLLGARGQVLAGEGSTPQLLLGYGRDFEWGSVALRLRGMTGGMGGAGGLLPSRHDELGLGLSVLRFIDLEPVSVAFGLFLEGVLHQQRFDSERQVSDRQALGAGYGGILLVERHLGGGVALRLEGGPVSGLFPRAEVRRGEEVGRALVTPLTWWANGGLVWHW
jgi:hypothetical protein